MAQLVEQRIRNAWVAGSSPAGSLDPPDCDAAGGFSVSEFIPVIREAYYFG